MKEHPRFLVLHLRHVIIAAVIFLLLILLSIVLIVNTSDKNTDETNIREEYKNIFSTLEKKDTKFYSITNIYRNFIVEYLKPSSES